MWLLHQSVLLTYYLDSRGVSTFDQMRELMISDRIKILSSACLQYITSIESSSETGWSGWLSLQKLTEAIDRFVASRGAEHVKPHACAMGQGVPRSSKPQLRTDQPFKPAMPSHVPQTPVKPYEKPKYWSGGNKFTVKSNTVYANKSPVKPISCFECDEIGHIRSICPRDTSGQY